jgi:hypothetical protein
MKLWQPQFLFLHFYIFHIHKIRDGIEGTGEQGVLTVKLHL